MLFAALAFVALWICVVRMGWTNYQLMESNKIEARPCFGVEGIRCTMTTSDRHQCQIRVQSGKTADNVKVELLALQDELEEVGKFIYPTFPIILHPDNGENTINPGSSQKYNFFQAVKSSASKHSFIGHFSEESAKEVMLFRGKKFYRAKLCVTARDLPKLEQDFFLRFFANDGDFWQFELIPVNSSSEEEAKRFNRASIIETLGQFRFALIERARQINKVPSDTWHKENEKDGDVQTARIFSEIEIFFKANAIELGTNALADFYSQKNLIRARINCVFGETIYHDEWEWTQNWIKNCEKNLSDIAERLNAKPL